jgi:hypothetical protein
MRAALLFAVLLPACKREANHVPWHNGPPCSKTLFEVPVPAGWRELPILAELGVPSVRTEHPGHLIKYTSRALGPFVVEFEQHDNWPPGGITIYQADCTNAGVTPRGVEILGYMIGTGRLREKDGTYILSIPGIGEEKGVAFRLR